MREKNETGGLGEGWAVRERVGERTESRHKMEYLFIMTTNQLKGFELG